MTAFEFKRKVNLTLLLTLLLLLGTAFIYSPTLYAAAESVQSGSYQTALICFAAALAFGLGAISAGIAISNVGSAAMGAISEKPEIASNALIFIGLSEGLVVFGFITALMILGTV